VVEVVFATVDHSDIRGSKRIIVIRRELPRTSPRLKRVERDRTNGDIVNHAYQSGCEFWLF
jgi:hypothetical protein